MKFLTSGSETKVESTFCESLTVLGGKANKPVLISKGKGCMGDKEDLVSLTGVSAGYKGCIFKDNTLTQCDM
jgi:hypothetical protein